MVTAVQTRAPDDRKPPYQSIFASNLFRGESIIVTGAGSGIGRCIAHELAALGADVALVGRNPDKLAATKNEITEDGGTAHSHVCDIRDDETVSRTVSEIL